MRLIPAIIALVLACVPLARGAISAPEGASLSLALLEEYRTSGVPEEKWPALMETLGNDEQRGSVRGLVLEMKPFPAARLVAVLTHPRLAVRLGALELLEDAAGESFGFDAWQENPSAGGNTEALGRWKVWAEKGGAETPQASLKLTDETFRVIAQEITSGQRERAERAMSRLDGFGLAAIAHIEEFLKNQPDLEAVPRAMLKAAEYRVVLRQALPRQAASLARDLALGAPEAQSAALAVVGTGGVGVLPVVADFLNSPDSLVRESAVDAAVEAGGDQAAALLSARLKEEKVESVLHALLKGLSGLASSSSNTAVIVSFLTHPSENVVVTALESLAATGAGSHQDALKARLADPRWRVRAAALETIGKSKISGLKSAVTERLHDEDLFVRVTAVQALTKLGSGIDALLPEFERQHDLKAPILAEVLSSRDGPLPPKVWELVAAAPPETILQCLETLVTRGDHEGKRVPFAAPFATHANPDVSAAALRILAGHGRYTTLLLGALQSKDPVKIDAVLDDLHLPASFFAGLTPAVPVPKTTPAGNPAIDRLFESFATPAPKGSAPAPVATVAEETTANPAVFREVLMKFVSDGSPQQRFRAALVLGIAREPSALQFLASSYPTLSPLDRRAIARSLEAVADWSDAGIKDLATRVVRDETDDVRETAVEVWLDRGSPERLSDLLNELSRPGSLLHPSDIYGWDLDRLLSSAAVRRPVLDWSKRILADPAGRDAHKVLAILLLARSGQADAALLEPFLSAKSAVLRRAAYRAIGLPGVESRMEALLRDESALVRVVLPFLVSPTNYSWNHYFDEASHVSDSQDFDRSFSSERGFGSWSGRTGAGATKLSDGLYTALEKLTRDPSDMVRFEAMFTLLRLGRPVEPATFAGLVASQSEEVNARERVGNYLEQNFQRLGKGYGMLVPLASGMRDDTVRKMYDHFGIKKKDAFASFAALAKFAPAVTRVADNAVALPPAEEPAKRVAEPFRILFFHKPGCRDCARVREMLARHATDFPMMTIEEHNIEERPVALLNETLSSRFRVKDTLHQATPAVFSQNGALLREDITFPALGDFIRSASTLAGDPQWAVVGQEEVAVADQQIAGRYATMSFVVVALAGLADGINPCAFATIIFLLSYLHVARRSPREILAVGAVFISAVFIAYFAAGLGLAQVLARISALQTAQMVLNYVLAGFALVVAVLSFRDAQLAARGQVEEMSLQLPGALKEHIRTAIRTSARAPRFVIAAFLAGLVVSLLELACTGQVYLPTILYMVRSGHTSAYGYLLLFNLAFIVPLIIVFLLAWRGMGSDALIRFQKKNTALVKVATGILFLLLFVLILFGHRFLPQITAGS